jgi:hypothetical protein
MPAPAGLSLADARAHLDTVRRAQLARFTPAEIDAMFSAHAEAEHAVDIDAVMETVQIDAIYELPALGTVLRGPRAVREYYVRTLAQYMESVRRVGDFRLRCYGHNFIVIESMTEVLQSDGSWLPAARTNVLEFGDDGRVFAERGYTAPAQQAMTRRWLGDDFYDVDGVFVLRPD